MKRLAFAALCVALVPMTVAAAGLAYVKPDAWKPVPTSSSMRVAQFAIPRAAGDSADAELVIYYFGGAGGSVEANIDRWIGQMQQPDGAASATRAKRSTRTINGLKVTQVDVSGTFVAEMAPGSSQRHNRPNYRLRAAVIETANGPYFIKLTGPAKTVAACEADLERFLGSVKYQS
jgi:hypothetical protein